MQENCMTTGQHIYELCDRIFPICRSITGDGVRETLRILDEYIADTGYHLNIVEVASGTKVFDWEVPKEWKIKNAYIENEAGHHIIDFQKNNLHVMGYSAPIDAWMDLDEMCGGGYLYTQPDEPDWIPYVTSYYKERVGFCMSENQKKLLKPGRYHLYCDSEFISGSLTYADLRIEGKTKDEILISTYTCHPSMANNECSGPALAAELIKYAASLKERKYTYRFVFGPETIGAITYISQHLDELKKHVIAGFNLSCTGDDRTYYMVETPDAMTLADRVMRNVLRYRGKFDTYSFLKRGSDERQYNAAGIDIPMVCFGRSKFGEYPQYHTSADDMSFVSAAGFQGSFEVMAEVIQALEHNERYRVPVLCEPQLGKRGLYPTVSQKGNYDEIRAMVDFIAYADGKRDLIEISDRVNQPVSVLIDVMKKLKKNKLLNFPIRRF